MSQVLVLVPRGIPVTGLPAGVLFVPFQTTVDAVVSLRASDAPAVVCTDGLDAEDLDSLAAAIRGRSATCIEVRSDGWDGESPSPVSAACRGVVSGFGSHGIRRAAELLAGVEVRQSAE